MRERLSQALFPAARCRLRVSEFVAVFLLSAVVAFCHLGSSSLLGLPWAEDGAVFLQNDVDHGFWASLPDSYGGYLNVGPRLAAGAVGLLPVSWYGLGLHAAAGLIDGAVAAIVYAALRGHLPGRLPRGAIALCVAAVPVGTDVVASIANMQWFLIFGASVALFWNARRAVSWVAIGLVAFVTTTTTPFAFVILFIAVLRWVIGRGRAALAVLAVTAVGFLLQMVSIANSERTLPAGGQSDVGPVTLARGFLSRVLGDAVFGTGRYVGVTLDAPTIRWGALVAVAVVVLAAATWRQTRIADLHFVVVMLVLAFGIYVIPVAASKAPVDMPFSGGRYYVAPTFFVLTAVMCLVARAGDMLARRVSVRAVGAAVVASLTVLAVSYGLVSSYDQALVSRRDQGPSWSMRVAAEKQACRGRAADTPVVIQSVPLRPEWVLTLTCGQLR